MARILSHLAALNFLTLLTAFVIGWVSFARGSRFEGADPMFPLHIYLGLVAGVTTLSVHSLIFIYFLGTGRWVKEVAQAYRIPDDPLPRLTRELKRRVFPPALIAMLVPIATTAAGAGVQTQSWWWGWHAALAALALVVNVWAFWVEYQTVSINAGVIDQIMTEVDRIRADHGLPSNAEALKQRE
jgi:phosphoglycerol transferase MdoB-like AlkP superfamily enzyme